MKKLYQQIWFYKEYVIIFFIGFSTIVWLMFSFGSTKNNTFKSIETKPKFSAKTIKESIVLPNKNLLLSSVQNGQINKKIFIQKYTSAFKSLNTIKGKVNLSFNFYKTDYKIKAAEIIIKYISTEVDQLVIKKQIIRISHDNK